MRWPLLLGVGEVDTLLGAPEVDPIGDFLKSLLEGYLKNHLEI